MQRRSILMVAGVLAACSAGGTGSLGSEPTSVGGSGAGGAGAATSGGTGGLAPPATGAAGSIAVGGTPGSTGGAAGTSATTGGATGSACDPPSDAPTDEICDGLDNDLDGFVDERGCSCATGQTQPCFDGPPSQASAPNCHMGVQTCVLQREFGEWGPCEGSGCDAVTTTEQCDNGTDDDCDGLVDEGCYLDAEVNLDGDCLSAFCPPQAPNPIGCAITMEGGDSRGCVSHLPGSPEVYFQEGNACPTCIPGLPCIGGAGRVFGTLRCSSSPDPVPLDGTTCIINKPEPSYTTPTATPITQPVSGCAL